MFQRTVLLSLSLIGVSLGIVLETPLGSIKGTSGVSRDGKGYVKFFKIPYAKPPIGDLRLKNPQPAGAWNSELDGTTPPEMCLQVPIFFSKDWNNTLGTENCLYLNVFTPELKPKKPLPVLVYIHGGGWRCGFPGPKDSADYFMDEDVILVNLQYRVGTLGFLSLEDETIPGNFGLKDQALALKWVKENIKSFGGDPERITIFGESAGGASTHYQMISPLSKNLIKGAISESGVVNKLWGVGKPGSAKPKAVRVAELVDCPTSDSKETLKCLQERDAKDIIKAELDFIYWNFEPAIVFQPMIEPKAKGAFLTQDPLSVKTTVPWITGITTEEGILARAFIDTEDTSLVDQFVQNIDTYLPRILFEDETNEAAVKTAQLVKEKYFPDLTNRDSVLKGIQDLYSDVYFIYPMSEGLKSHKGKKFIYLNDYRGGHSLMEIISGKRFEGVSHADELLLLFNWREQYPKLAENEETVSKNVVKMWANFARYQDPKTELSDWKEAKESEYLYIGDMTKMKKTPYRADRIKFWQKLPLMKAKVNVKEEL